MSHFSTVSSDNLKEPNLLIIGQGDIGLAVTNRLAEQQVKVTGLARGEKHAYDLHQRAHYIQADALKLTADQIKDFTHIAIIVTPDTYEADNLFRHCTAHC